MDQGVKTELVSSKEHGRATISTSVLWTPKEQHGACCNEHGRAVMSTGVLWTPGSSTGHAVMSTGMS
ncbi:hypothetical protein JCGZ_03737 [Jatropha curcas]|uniref:Uncharacterized protein n=1 Tax=Jatropha curcas TaxID=180498 RepID=A0A067JPY6_JATCU|nr:hypothetical protein JCGZ_03737 [Jatropha curcas]